MPDINRYWDRYWDLKDELYAVIEEMFSGGNGSSASYEELIARRDAIYAELVDLQQEFDSIQFNHDEYDDSMESDDMDDPDSMDEDLDLYDYDDY